MVESQAEQQYFYGTGKRKTSIAKVRLYLDEGGPILVNNKPMDEYFNWLPWQNTVLQPLKVSDTLNRFRVVVKVLGGRRQLAGPGHRPRHRQGIVGIRPGDEARPAPQWLDYPGCPHQGKQEVRPEARPPGAAIHQALSTQIPSPFMGEG